MATEGVEEQFTTVIPQEMYLFCCFSAYLQVFLALYNYLALHVIEVCIRPCSFALLPCVRAYAYEEGGMPEM
jgi:hypothetical protein